MSVLKKIENEFHFLKTLGFTHKSTKSALEHVADYTLGNLTISVCFDVRMNTTFVCLIDITEGLPNLAVTSLLDFEIGDESEREEANSRIEALNNTKMKLTLFSNEKPVLVAKAYAKFILEHLAEILTLPTKVNFIPSGAYKIKTYVTQSGRLVEKNLPDTELKNSSSDSL